MSGCKENIITSGSIKGGGSSNRSRTIGYHCPNHQINPSFRVHLRRKIVRRLCILECILVTNVDPIGILAPIVIAFPIQITTEIHPEGLSYLWQTTPSRLPGAQRREAVQDHSEQAEGGLPTWINLQALDYSSLAHCKGEL